MNHQALQIRLILGLLAGATITLAAEASDLTVIELESRRELFVDDYLIDQNLGLQHRLHAPVSRGSVFNFDQPWEGNTPFHVTVMQDDGTYRMYYRGSTHNHLMQEELRPGETLIPSHPQVTAYAESKDGVNWVRPSLGQVQFNGATDNNILDLKGTSRISPFIDTSSNAKDGWKYKAMAHSGKEDGGKRGLVPLRSRDAVRWERMSDVALITDGWFDSHNISFWDEQRQLYVAIYRDFYHGIRSIKFSSSKDFINWEPGVWADFGDAPLEHLYTNATIPYERSPHIYLAFPKRLVPWRNPQHLSTTSETERPGISEALFMSSRDGIHWNKYTEAFIRPGRERRNWIHRSNFVARGILPLAPDELSLYVVRHYTYPSAHLERMVVRTDGFVSLHAGYPGGEMVTKPFTFTGDNLYLNYATSAAGQIQVEVQDENGIPIPGYSLLEAKPLWGDEIEGVVRWEHASTKGGENQLNRLQGRVVRLRFVMKDADLFSIQFRQTGDPNGKAFPAGVNQSRIGEPASSVSLNLQAAGWAQNN